MYWLVNKWYRNMEIMKLITRERDLFFFFFANILYIIEYALYYQCRGSRMRGEGGGRDVKGELKVLVYTPPTSWWGRSKIPFFLFFTHN